MNKAEFIDFLAKTHSISKAEAERLINTFVDGVTAVLSKGKELQLIGFGQFYVTKTAARTGRNPSTGAPLKIAAGKLVRFRPGAKLKSAVK